ncbi:MAG: competence/damage-inducible protein A, partial [Lentisphaerae bacterium]
MSIALVCIGNEILDGDTLNTNLQALARSLKQWGYAISEEVCICDTPQAIEEQLNRLLRTAKLIFTIGGLGPTRDDLTRETIARLLNKKLVLDQDLMEKISSRFRHRNSPDFEQARRKQATIIEGAKVLFNHWGIAPGLWCLLPDDKVICMLPGPPRECVPMIQHYLPELLKTLMPPQRACVTLPVFGIGESSVAAQTDPVLADYP